jgi:hypothetical protein
VPIHSKSSHFASCVHTSFANKLNRTAEVRGLGEQFLCVGPELSRCVRFYVITRKFVRSEKNLIRWGSVATALVLLCGYQGPMALREMIQEIMVSKDKPNSWWPPGNYQILVPGQNQVISW